MAFSGYLLKIGTGNSAVEFPMKYISYDTYSVTPNQRQEQKASRNAKGLLVRVTLSHMPVKIEFETNDGMTNTDVAQIGTLLRGKYIIQKERKLNITYYDPEEDTYKTAQCYMPDVQYKIKNIDKANNKVYYNKLRYAFIEY